MSEISSDPLDWSLGGPGLGGRVAQLAALAFDPRFREAWSQAQVESILRLGGGWINVGLDAAGELKAFALNRQVLDEVELLLVAIHPDIRRRGIGSILLDKVKNTSFQRDARRIFLEVRSTNEAARALYRKNGFTPCGMRPSYYSSSDGLLIDAITLEYEIK